MTPASCVSSVTAACVRRRRHATTPRRGCCRPMLCTATGCMPSSACPMARGWATPGWCGAMACRDRISAMRCCPNSPGKAMPVRRRGRCLPMRVASWACAICMASPTWTTWCPERSCWAWACRSAGWSSCRAWTARAGCMPRRVRPALPVHVDAQPRSSASCACSSATAASSWATRSARPGSAASLLPLLLAYFAASAAPSTSPHSRCM